MLEIVTRLTKPLFALFSLIVLLGSAQAAIIPAPPQLAADSYLLMDANSGRIIVEHNIHDPVPQASLTKMMTSYIVEQEIKSGRMALDDKTRISIKAWQTGGSKMFIRESDYVTIEDLLKGVIIQSGNDASVALAEHVAGEETVFADMMNRYAAKLGMNNTYYEDATGLSTKNVSTAYDLALLAQRLIKDNSDYYPWYAEKEFTYAGIKQSNRNWLLWRDPTVDGIKTGHTEAAGYCLVSSAVQEGMRLIAVVMGTKSEEARAQESQKLLTYGFRYYQSRQLYIAGEPLNDARVWAGVNEQVPVGVNTNVTVTFPRGDENRIKAALNIQPVIEAPVKAGNVLGALVVSLDDEVLAEQPLIALADVEEAGFFSRMTDYVALFFHNLFE